MSNLYAEDIPAGSHKVYVWEDGEYGDTIDLVCIFQPFRDGGLIGAVHGRLTRRTIKELMTFARKQGYMKMYFSRAFGVRFERFAQYAFSEDGLDYYRIDLDGHTAG